MAHKASFHWDDPLLLNEQLTDDERMVRDASAAYCKDRLKPRVLEAFRHGRPVICSDAGGMAELVRNGMDGLHAPIGDAEGWAATMRRAIEEPGLWDRLVQGIRHPTGLDAMAGEHLDLYRRLLRRPAFARSARHSAQRDQPEAA